MNDKIVEILSGTPGKRGHYLSRVYDRDTGTYFGPILPQKDEEDEEFEHLFKIVHPDKNLKDMSLKIAVIDSGMLRDHPLIKPYLVESVDFTGEGPEDFNGHGTVSALLALQNTPGLKLLNVKALDAEGRGTSENLVKAIEWAVEHGAKFINISAGIYRKKWGLFECKGDCEVCQAAERAGKSGVLVTAAAGNEAGKTYCPAKVGVLKKDSGVAGVAAALLDGTPSPTTGYGSHAAIGQFQFGPVVPVLSQSVPHLTTSGDLWVEQGKYREAQAVFELALQAAQNQSSKEKQADVLDRLGNIALVLHEYDNAHEYYNMMLAITHDLDKPELEAEACYKLGWIARERNEWDKAEQHYLNSLNIYNRLGNVLGAAMSCAQLGINAQKSSSLAEAEKWYKQALGYDELPAHIKVPICNELAYLLSESLKVYSSTIHLDEIQIFAERILAIMENIGSKEIWIPLHLLAKISDLEQQTEAARDYRRREREAFARSDPNRQQIDHKYGPLINAIAASAQGDTKARAVVEALFPKMEAGTWRELPAVIRSIWSGQRDWQVLVEDLDVQSALLIQRVLETITQ